VQLFNDVREKVTAIAADNATTLLTAGGVVGVVATAVLTGRASIKAYQVLEDAKPVDEEPIEPLTKAQKIILVGPQFIPPVLTGSVTIAAIIMANRMNAQKAAALVAAYGVTQKHFEEYKTKVAEKLTGPKQNQVNDELAQERVNRTPGHESVIVVEGEVLCFDQPTGRYFRSTMENINRAVNSTNAEIIHHDYASASYFYEELDMPATTWTDEVGWNTDQLLDLTISTVLDPHGRPCIAIDFKALPKVDYVPKHY
jgi:Family of unknown function (DUF6353)